MGGIDLKYCKFQELMGFDVLRNLMHKSHSSVSPLSDSYKTVFLQIRVENDVFFQILVTWTQC